MSLSLLKLAQALRQVILELSAGGLAPSERQPVGRHEGPSFIIGWNR